MQRVRLYSQKEYRSAAVLFSASVGHDLNIRDRAVYAIPANQRLMNHDFRIRQCDPFAFCAASQKESTKAGGQTDADGRYITLYILHGVVDRKPGCDRVSGTVDVKLNSCPLFAIPPTARYTHRAGQAAHNPARPAACGYKALPYRLLSA